MRTAKAEVVRPNAEIVRVGLESLFGLNNILSNRLQAEAPR